MSLEGFIVKYGFALALSMAVFASALPLIVFAVESAAHKPIIAVSVSVVRPVNTTHLLLRVTVEYHGSIPLENVVVEVGGRKVELGALEPESASSARLVLPAGELERVGRVGLSFSLAGVYKFNRSIPVGRAS